MNMNTPNPLVPQGSLQEQGQRKSQVRLIVFTILAIHVVLLGALLIQGCKREDAQNPKVEAPPPLVDTNPIVPPPPPPFAESNPVPFPEPVGPTSPPPTTTREPEPPAAGATEHLIAKGETFGSLARKYGVSVRAIQMANPGVDSTKLKIGQKIMIPAKPPAGAAGPSTSSMRTTEPEVGVGETLYTVKAGDTLTKISKATGVSIKAIRAANNLRTDQLRPGQKLKVPAKTGTTPAAPAPAVPSAPTSPPPAGGAPASLPTP